MSNKNSTDDWVKISTKDFANKEDFLGTILLIISRRFVIYNFTLKCKFFCCERLWAGHWLKIAFLQAIMFFLNRFMFLVFLQNWLFVACCDENNFRGYNNKSKNFFFLWQKSDTIFFQLVCNYYFKAWNETKLDLEMNVKLGSKWYLEWKYILVWKQQVWTFL